MSASTGPSSKGEKGKSKYRSLDINNIYNNTRSESSEAQQTKSQAPRRHGMQSLGKVPQRRPPANLPSLRSENSGNDPSVSLIPTGATGWGVKPGETQATQIPPSTPAQPPNPPQSTTSTSSVAPAAAAPPAPLPVTTQNISPPTQVNSNNVAVPSVGSGSSATSGDKTWSSVMSGGGSGGSSDHGPSFLAHQSPQFHQEFPSLSGEPGGAPAHPPGYGPGPSLRPQTEGSWSQGGARPPPQQQANISHQFKTVIPPFILRSGGDFPMFPESLSTRTRSQSSNHSENRMPSQGGSSNRGGSNQPLNDTDEIITRPIIKEEDLHKMDELARDASWAANDDIDYTEKLAFSDGESVGEDEKEKENKIKEKSKLPNTAIKDDRKESELDKVPRDKMFSGERNHWRVGGAFPPEYNCNPSLKSPLQSQANRVDDEELWKEKRRMVQITKLSVTEKAKQRKEEEEKRFEESRAKKGGKEETSDFHSVVGSNIPEWEKEDRLKSSDNFKQMTQNFNFQMDGNNRTNINREKERDREIRRDRDCHPQFGRYSSNRENNKPPRFRKDTKGQGSYNSGGGGSFESKWGNQGSQQHMGPRRSHEGPDKEDDFRKDSFRISDSGNERFRNRDERISESSKRNYYENHQSDYNSQSSYQQQISRESDKDKEVKDYDYRLSDKGIEKDSDKQWEPSKGEVEVRHFEEKSRKDSRMMNDNLPKQLIDQFEDAERKDRPQRPESRDRPSRPDSRDSRASKESRNSRDDRNLQPPVEGDYSWQENDFERERICERLSYKEKDIRRDPIPHRLRDHVPGPITPEKIEAYELKHNQFQAEKKNKDEKESETKILKSSEVDTDGNWVQPSDDKMSLQQSSKLVQDQRQDVLEDHDKSKEDNLDKRKESSIRDKRDDKSSRGGNRNRGGANAPRMSMYNSGGGYGAPRSSNNWVSREQRPRRNSPKGRLKQLYQSESDNSTDEVSASTESGKEEKKSEKKQPPRSPKLNSSWKSEKSPREDKGRDSKSGENEKFKLDKKPLQNSNEGTRKNEGSSSSGGFAPRGEPSRRGRGGHLRGVTGTSRIIGNAHYGPPGSKPFTSSSGGNAPPLSQQQIDSQDKQFSPPQPGRKNDDHGKRDSDLKLNKGKGRPQKHSGDTDECYETTSEASDSSDMKKSNKGRSKSEKKTRGTIGDKRGMINSAYLNGRPGRDDGKGDDSGSEKKFSKDDMENSGQSNNGFQEVKSKKTGREGRPIKDEVKRSRSKPKDKSGGIKCQQTKSFSREFVSNKPPRMQRMENFMKQQQQQQPDISDMNKVNQQSVPSIFHVKSNDTGMGCPPPPPPNAWNKPFSATLRTTPPLSSSLSGTMATDKNLDINDIGQSGNNSQSGSPSAEKAISKIREVEKGLLDGATPPVNTIIFENTNFKRDSSDMSLKPNRFPASGPRSLDKGSRKIDDDMNDGSHGINLGGFKPSSDIQPGEGKTQDTIQVPMSFSKNEDNADMKLDFAFDSDLSQLSDDKSNPSVHVGQTSAADLNQKIASVKKVWDSAPGMGGHVDEPHGTGSSFTQGFPNDKSLDPSGTAHHTDHPDFNPQDSVYSSGGQLPGSAGGYVSTGAMMKPDPVNSVNMCKASIFQMNPQPQVAVLPSTIGTHPGPLSTPPPLLNYQAAYTGNLPAVPSPPNVLYNSQQPTHQADLYNPYPLGNNAQIHTTGSRSYSDYSQSYSLSQNSSFQHGMYMQQAGPPNPPSVFQNAATPFRLPPHGSTMSQQISNNPSQVLMPTSSNSIVSGSQVKSTQPAIGTKAGGSGPTFPPHSQIVLLDPSMGYMTGSQFLTQRPPTMAPSTSYYSNPGVTLTTGSQPGGLFNSSLLTGGGGVGALPSANQYGGVGFNTGNQAAAQPNSGPPNPPSQLPQQPYPSQVMGGSYRNQSFSKTGQHPGDSAKSPSQDQFQSMFAQGSMVCNNKVRVGSKPQPSGSPQPQQHKFSSYSNPHSASQSNLVYQQGGGQQSGGNGNSRSGMSSGGMGSGGAIRSGTNNPSGMQPNGAQNRYVSPIQRPMGGYQQQQQQQMMQRPQHRMRCPPPTITNKQYYHQQGSMKLDSETKNETEESSKGVQDKSIKDETPSDQ